MISHTRLLAPALLVLALLPLGSLRAVAAVEAAVNHALTARVTACGHYSGAYLPGFAADGKIPNGQENQDAGEAWCVPRQSIGDEGAWLRFEWDEPVAVQVIAYYGRTAWLWNENFRHVQVRVNGDHTAVGEADLEPGHGAQLIRLTEPVRATSLTLVFDGFDTGPNPGASEVQLFSAEPTADQIQPLQSPATYVPPIPDSTVPEDPALARAASNGALGFTQLVVVQRAALNPSHVYTYHNEGFRPGGGLFVYTLAPEPGKGELRQLIDASQGQILDCELSYDGDQILFSWKRDFETEYQIFRIHLDGSGLTQLTHQGCNFNPCWLPDGGIAFLSTRESAFAYCWSSAVGRVYRMDRDGGSIKRLSANYLNDFTPTVLNDGRIIYGRWEYVDRPAIPIQSLWTLNPDGTGLRVFYGNRVLSPATFMDPRAIPGSEAVLCVLTAHNGPCRGALGIVDRRLGVNAQEAIRNLTPEIGIGTIDQGGFGNIIRGPYESPLPVDETYFLCSRQGAVFVRDYATTHEALLLNPTAGLGFYSARPVRATARPPVVPSVLPDDPDPPRTATLYLQDVYNGLEPHVPRGMVKQIAVVQEVEKPVSISPDLRAFGFQFPVVSCGATYAPKKLWGTAAVREDGSAHFSVPSDVPLYFLALDSEGRALQRMRSFTHLVPGERQGCIGCHENRLHAPGRRTRPQASLEAPQPLDEPEWGVTGFSYPHLVQPVLDRHCVTCHNAREHPKGVDLSGDATDFFSVSYETLAREGPPGQNPYTSWIPTYNGMEANILQITPLTWGSPKSRLADLIRNGHPDKAGVPRVRLSAAEKRRVFAWIDLNVPYYGTSDSFHRERVGCRQILPPDLEPVLNRVAEKRCVSCHGHRDDGTPGLPRKEYVRITNPANNSFLMAPLAREAGGNEACGEAVFASVDDPDYRAILDTFAHVGQLLSENPRMDMRPLEGAAQCQACATGGPGCP